MDERNNSKALVGIIIGIAVGAAISSPAWF
jgi:hypothetical protein